MSYLRSRLIHIYDMKHLLTLLFALSILPVCAQDYGTLYKKGVELIENKEYTWAIPVLEQALPLAGERGKFSILVNLAYSQMMTGELEKAIDNYSRAHALRPWENSVLFQRSSAYMQLGRIDEAINDCDRIIDAMPDNADALVTRAQAYMLKGEYKKTKDDLVKAITAEPGNTEARVGLVQLYRKEKKYDEAMVLIGLMIEEHPDNATLYIVRSDIERELGQTELALMDVSKAIEIDPENPEFHTLQAILYEMCDKKPAAARSRKKANALKLKKGPEQSNRTTGIF